MPGKKQKVSDFTTEDKTLLASILKNMVKEADPEDEEMRENVTQLEDVAAKLASVKNISFSNTTLADVPKQTFFLDWKDGALARARQAGQPDIPGDFLTLGLTRQMISRVRRHVSLKTEAGCRQIIDIILLRLASILSRPESRILIFPEFSITSTAVPTGGTRSYGGVVDYLLAQVAERYSSFVLLNPAEGFKTSGPTATSLNIFEAKTNKLLEESFPQIVVELKVWCQIYKKPYARGVITSGDEWNFFAYRAAAEGRVEQYGRCAPIKLGDDHENLDVIFALLTDWILHTDQGDFDYFDMLS